MHNVEPGVSVKLGLLVCRRILGYLRTGFVINKINLSQQSSFTYIDNFDTQATVNSSGKTHNHTSIYLMLGAGFEFEFTPHTTLSLDDTYTIYNSRTLNNTASIIDGNVDTATLTNSIKLHTAMNTIMIGLNHYF